MKLRATLFALVIAATMNCSACYDPAKEPSEIRQFPVDSLNGLISKGGVMLDKKVSSDGRGSVRITVSKPGVVRLYESRNIDLENARLFYQARLRTEGVVGKVYLEMWCKFTGIGEFFSRSLNHTLTGSNDWTTVKTPFNLKKGQNPDLVKLNVVIEGKGTVWVDDIRLLRGPPK